MEPSRTMRVLRTSLTPGSGDLDEVTAVVTIPAFHAPVHYEVDRALGVLRVTKMLRNEPRLVHSCGFIPRTCVGDGRPLEVAVFAPWTLERPLARLGTPSRNAFYVLRQRHGDKDYRGAIR